MKQDYEVIHELERGFSCCLNVCGELKFVASSQVHKNSLSKRMKGVRIAGLKSNPKPENGISTTTRIPQKKNIQAITPDRISLPHIPMYPIMKLNSAIACGFPS